MLNGKKTVLSKKTVKTSSGPYVYMSNGAESKRGMQTLFL